MHAEPTTWRRLLDTGWRAPTKQFLALASGEPLPADAAHELADRVHRLISLYGQAETGFWSGLVELQAHIPANGLAPLGTPLPGVGWHVVDTRFQPVPSGVPGELIVSGPGLARGYAAPATAAHDPLVISADGTRWVRTGDRVRVRADGAIEYRGRLDARTVVQGLRVEPAALEQVLEQHPAVRAAAIAARDEDGERRLVAWIVPAPDADYTDSELRRWLRQRLPGILVPRRYFELDELPRLADGKLDRIALPTPLNGSLFDRVAPRTEAERLLGELWREALALDAVGVHDNFFDLGGHSLACIQVISRLEKASGQRLNPRLLLLNTLEQVAAQLEFGEGK
jgi:acyl-coenzyme A synthetase/AMP-(fatty) acid ligase